MKLLSYSRVALPAKNEPLQSVRITVLALGHLFNDMYVGFLPALLPLLIERTGITLTAAAALTSTLSVFTSLAQPIFGHTADRIRRPYLSAFGPLITAVFFSLIGFAYSYSALIVCIVCAGIGTAAFHPQSASLAGRSSGRQSGLGMSLFVTGGNFGYYLGPIVIMSIVTLLGLQYSYIAVLPGLIISFLLFRLLPNLPQTARQQIKQSLALVIPHQLRIFLLLLFISVIRSFVVSGFNTFIPIYLQQQHYDPMMYAAGLTIFGMPGALGALLGGSLSDRLGRKTVLLFSMAGALPFLHLFLKLQGIPAMICLGLGGFFILSSIPVVIVMAQELLPGRINTASALVMGLSWGIGGVMVTPLGLVADHFGLSTALTLLVSFGFIACILVFFLPETKRVSYE
jgi:MFS transporter, FSR family, fosmidomycin resistance protein